MRTSRALSLIRIFACYVVDVSVVELLNPFVTCQVPLCSRFGTADHGQLLLKDSLINRCGTPWQPQVYLLLAWEVSVVVVIFISIKHNNNNTPMQSQAQVEMLRQQNLLPNPAATGHTSPIAHSASSANHAISPSSQSSIVLRPNSGVTTTPDLLRSQNAVPTPPAINTDEVVKKLREDLKGDLASTIREFQAQHKKEMEPPTKLPGHSPLPFPFPLQPPGPISPTSTCGSTIFKCTTNSNCTTNSHSHGASSFTS